MNNSYQNKPFYPENFNERISNNAHKPSQNLFNCLIPNFSNTQENLLSLLNNIKGNPFTGSDLSPN